MLSSFMAPAAWTFRFASRLASAFGYAKPLRTTVKTIKVKASSQFNNADGEDPAYNMSLLHDACLAPFSVNGRPLDEMSFEYLASAPHFITQVNLGSQTAGSLLCKGFLSPMALFTQGSTVTLPNGGATAPFNAFYPSAPSVLASCFVQYRGDFVFKFVIQKTRFHSGRLLFGYNYFMGDNTTFTTVNVPSMTSPYINRTIIDLNQTSEVEIVVPFHFPGNMALTNDYIGTWGLWVLEPVSAPPAAPSTIPINLVASMKNVLFAAPRTSNFSPTDNYNNIVFQSGIKGVGFQAALSGEDVNSVKQLLMKGSSPINIISNVPFDPWAIRYPTYAPNSVTPTTITLPTPTTPHPHLNLFRTAFAFERGAMVAMYSRPQANTVARIFTTPPSFGTRTNTFRNVCPSAADIVTNMPIVRLNRYCNLPATLCGSTTSMPREMGSYASTQFFSDVRDSNNAVVANTDIAFCVADDFSLHSFTGFEPVVFSNPTEMAF
jgi:hypothetical protein